MWRAIEKIKYFLLNLFIALKDASLEYDMQIKQTKSPTYRLIFWLAIGLLVVALVVLLLWFLRSLVTPIQNLNFQ